jgi:DNA-binding transcriptional LysR family regulator
MDIVKAMQAFVAVVEQGSLVKAAELLERPTAVVSRQLSALEAHLSTRLLQRTTRRQALTEAGQEFYQRAQQILADLEEAEAIVSQQTLKPEGLLRVSAPLSFAIHRLADLLPGLCDLYPQLRLDIFVTDRTVDLLHDGIDVALLTRLDPDENVVAREICKLPLVACAAPSYLARHGEPRHPCELAAHRTLSYTYVTFSEPWNFIDEAGNACQAQIDAHVRATTADVLRALASAGHGIVAVPRYVVEDLLAAGTLRAILTDWRLNPLPLYAVFPSRKFVSAKVRVFIEHLLAHLGPPDPHRLKLGAGH